MLRLHRATRGMPAVELGRRAGLRDVRVGTRLPASVLPHGAHDRRPQVGRRGLAVAPARAVCSQAKSGVVHHQTMTSKLARTVLHAIETGGPGGAERMLVHLATGLSPDYQSEAALIRDRWLAATLRGRGVRVTMLRYTSDRFAGTLRDLVKLIRNRRVAVLHTHEFFMNTLGLMASWLTGVPLVATVHGRNYYSDRARRRVAYRLVGRFAGQMVTVSEANKRFLAERVGIPARRIQVIPNGVPLDDRPGAATLSALRESLGIDQHHTVVGTVGSLYPVKGHRYLIDAVPFILSRFPQTVFVIVGQGELREELESQAVRLGVAPHLRFLGHRDDVHNLLTIY